MGQPAGQALPVWREHREPGLFSPPELTDGRLERLVLGHGGRILCDLADRRIAVAGGEALFDPPSREHSAVPSVPVDDRESIPPLVREALDGLANWNVLGQHRMNRLHGVSNREYRHDVCRPRAVDVDSTPAKLRRIDRVMTQEVTDRNRQRDGEHQRQDDLVVASQLEDDQDRGDRRP